MIQDLPAAKVHLYCVEGDALGRLVLSALLAVSVVSAGSPSSAATACAVTDTMVSVSNYWVEHGTELDANNWQNATYHIGNLAVVRTTGVSNHRTLPWAEANKYQLPGQDFRAANFTSGEAYEDLAFFHPDPANLQPLRDRISAQISAGKLSTWDTPMDVLLAMPAYLRLNTPAISSAAFTLFERVSRLFDARTGLWWQDWRFVGSPVYWSQANASALAGLVKAVLALPADDPHRPAYVDLVRRTAAALKGLQRPDGAWGTDLTHPWLFGAESNGTALITYAFAAGANNGLLDTSYAAAAQRGWTWLTTKALQPGGKLGYVQIPGSAPWDNWPINPATTAAFAVGDFLIAGQQIAHLTPACTTP